MLIEYMVRLFHECAQVTFKFVEDGIAEANWAKFDRFTAEAEGAAVEVGHLLGCWSFSHW